MRFLKKVLILFFVSLLPLIIFASAVQSSESKVVLKKSVNVKIYIDYACNACAYEDGLVKNLRNKFGSQVIFSFINYPFEGPNSFLAARAVEAAKNQGKFLQMHEWLLEKQPEWVTLPNPKNYFLKTAGSLGLDVGKFTADLDSNATKERVDADVQLAKEAKVAGAPTVFIDGKNEGYITSAQDFEEKIVSAGESEKSLLQQMSDLIDKAGNDMALGIIALFLVGLAIKYRPELVGIIIRLTERKRGTFE